ncbi:MAG: hypothetical protein GXP26_14880, partial [Planctomycetes bacterium]|nr:hypothetical protein [Planctomycetota bacterium]
MSDGYNSRIHAPAPKRQPGQRGQTRVRGERLDTPEEILDAKGLRRVGLKLAEQILQWFSWRRPIEVFHDSKQHLGLSEAENRKTKAVRRTVPAGLLMPSLLAWGLVVLWHECIRQKPAPRWSP